MKKFLSNLSFRAKLLFGLISLNIVIVLVILYYFPLQAKKQGYNSLIDKGISVSKMTSVATSVGLEFEDKQSINDALKLARQNREFVFATIYNSNNEHFIGVNDSLYFMDKTTLAEIDSAKYEIKDNILYLYQPILGSSNSKIGWLVMGFSMEYTNNFIASNFRATLIVGLLILLGAIIFSFLFGNIVSKPINNMIIRIKDIAQGEGDLTKKIDINTKDEFGELAYWFNIFVEQLRQIILDIKKNVKVIEEAVVTLREVTESLKSDFEKENTQIHQIASSIEEITSTIIETSSNADTAKDLAKETKDFAIEGENIVKTSIEEMHTIANIVNSAARIIAELGKSSDEIGEVVSVIDNIADQTNLLALNAAIEAARAGEQGRGFAVVADEVRKLAERTTNATKEIADMISSIQKDTESAVKSTKEGTEYVEKGVNSSNRVGHFLNDINQKLIKVLEMVEYIANAANEESSAAEKIAENISDITNIVGNSVQVVDNLAYSSEKLYKQTEHLKDLIGKFILGNEDYIEMSNSNNDNSDFFSENDNDREESTGLKLVE